MRYADPSTKSFDAIIFNDTSTAGRYDVYNTSGTELNAELSNLSNADSYCLDGSTVIFQSSVLLSLTVKDEGGDPIVGAKAYIDNDDDSPYIMNTTTNALGVASTTYSGGAVSDAIWRVRKYGYKPFKAISDITASNKDIPVTLIADPQQT